MLSVIASHSGANEFISGSALYFRVALQQRAHLKLADQASQLDFIAFDHFLLSKD